MAEMATVRRVTLEDGTTAELDGDTLSVASNTASGFVISLKEADKDALIWLLRGTSPRKDRGTVKARASRKPDPLPEPVE